MLRDAAIAVLSIVAGSGVMLAADDLGGGGLDTYQIRPNFYMIVGAGANIGVQLGEDGVVLVDSGSAAKSQDVLAAIKKITPKPIRYLVNTSADPDHVGGNEVLANAGKPFRAANPGGGGGLPGAGAAGAPDQANITVMSTAEVFDRMAVPKGNQPPYPSAALPTETFFEPEKPFYLNGEGVEVIHEPAAHTDGDAIVFFRRSDVIMAGEILDTTRFPVIDLEKGGSIQGEIDALSQLVKIAIPSIPLVWKEGGTLVVPAHGFINEQSEVVEYRDMMIIIRDVVQDLIKQGKTLAQVKEANPTQGYRSRYGTDSGPWTTDMFVEAVYKSLTEKK
jgi:glyoxylase-like metal-dependent hydrolase (beta-lactamase superfamily II)